MHRASIFAVLLAGLALFVPATGRGRTREDVNREARDIFRQLIETNTTDSVGNVTTAAEAMQTRLREAGFSDKDMMLAGPNDRKKNLVVRYRGTGKQKPVLFTDTWT